MFRAPKEDFLLAHPSIASSFSQFEFVNPENTRDAALGSKQSSVSGRFWPIMLKKSAMVCPSEKYASEIKIFTFGRGVRNRISRSSAQKRRFKQSMIRPFGQSDFFNRIGRLLPVTTAAFGGFLPILYGGDDRQRSNSGGLPIRMWL